MSDSGYVWAVLGAIAMIWLVGFCCGLLLAFWIGSHEARRHEKEEHDGD